ncbi:MAG: hypothetical protein H7122_03625 [Chitinophagaceae bacterium]|nr:hypothetical protein [Chitinophagaceae bacterium]
MEKNTIIYFCGLHSVLFAVFHACFWKLFNWSSELKKIERNNRAIMQILNLRLIYLFLFSAFLCFFFTRDLYTTSLGKAFLVGMSIFWLGRTIEQFIFLPLNHWRVHVLTILFISGTIIFLVPVFY